MSTADELVREHEALREARGVDDLTVLAAGSRAVAALVSEGRAGEAVDLGRELVAARSRAQGPRREDTLRERRNWSLALGRSGQLLAAYDETCDLLDVARHALGLRHQLTLTVAADNERWRTALGLPDPASVPPEPPTPAPAPSLEAPADQVVSDQPTGSRSGEGWGPDDRRAMYKAMGKDYRVVDDELRAAELVEAGSYAEALRVIDDVIPRLRRIYRRDGPHILRMRLLGAQCLLNLGMSQAKPEIAAIVQASQETLGPDHQITLEARALEAGASFHFGDRLAAAQFAALAEKAEAAAGNAGADEAALHFRVLEGVALGANGDWPAAHRVLSQALASALGTLPDDDPWLLRLRYSQAATVHRTGDLAGALALLEDVVLDMDSALGPLAEDSRDSREALARLVHQSGDTARAVALMTEVRQQAAAQGADKQVRRADDALRAWSGRRRRFGFAP